MEFQKLIERAREIKKINLELTQSENCKIWGNTERVLGFVGDVGALAKLIMAKNGYRKYENVDKKLAHELGDCFWSIITIADEAGVDLEKAFFETMKEIELRKNNFL
jgi:NTP pyrophosphatase (non-canonical NTP hydrolase)